MLATPLACHCFSDLIYTPLLTSTCTECVLLQACLLPRYCNSLPVPLPQLEWSSCQPGLLSVLLPVSPVPRTMNGIVNVSAWFCMLSEWTGTRIGPTLLQHNILFIGRQDIPLILQLTFRPISAEDRPLVFPTSSLTFCLRDFLGLQINQE